MDYFGARYYASSMGRFLSADWSAGPATVPYAHLENPQTLNLYAYVDNNPINGVDEDGHAAQMAPVADSVPGNIMVGAGVSPFIDRNYYKDATFDANEAELENKQQQAQSQNQQKQQSATTQPVTMAPGGLNPNYRLPRVDTVLKTASDFSAGAGDVLSLGTTYLARKYIFHSDSVVSKTSGAYITGALTGAAIGIAIGTEMGPRGKIFGTRFGGNQPLLNSNDRLRIGWSYIRSSGQYVFRVGGSAVGAIKANPHINLWPPSWWLK